MAERVIAELFASPFSLVCKGVWLARPLQKASHCETNSDYLQIDDQREDAATHELPSAPLAKSRGFSTMRLACQYLTWRGAAGSASADVIKISCFSTRVLTQNKGRTIS